MVGVIGRSLALGLALCAAGCARPASPTEVVAAYFAALGRDPIRTLPLLTPAFHEQHGLHAVTSAEARAGGSGEAPRAGALAVDRFELGWLAVQSREGFRALRGLLAVTPVRDEITGDRAGVTVLVQAGAGPAFEQRFALAREAPGASWRIDSIEQSGVAPGAELAAFVAHPTEAERQRLERISRAGG